ncbi:MAG: toxin-antitoxin system HicB family antitoxin [Candidatus Poribacteria bacterium]|nr:toxin-antitoxin system HicB family antitoxin [Candidatus Poribacteria bacterium]
MKTMTYKGYTAEIIYSEEDSFFVGHVVDIGDDIVSFHGDTDAELQDAFEGVLDHYLEVKGRPENPPQKHFAWRFLARLRQAFHL